MAHQRNLRDVLVGEVNNEPLPIGVIFSDADSDPSLYVKVWDLDVSGEDIQVPVVLQNGLCLSGLST